MPKNHRLIQPPPNFYRSLVAAALLANGVFLFTSPILAEGTSAGTSISNTATATYEDPNKPGTTINATSNTVTVSVAEVAGIAVTSTGVVDNNGGSVGIGDLLIYNYTLTNVGNDPTKFHIPNQASTTGQGTVAGVLPKDKNNQDPVSGQLQYSTDNGATWTNVPPGGVDTPSVLVGGTVLVRVPVTVAAGAQTNDVITVTLGDTSPVNAQNQPRTNGGGDVFTVDNPDPATNVPGQEVIGAPINGTREASATQQIQVGAVQKDYALATLFKVRGTYNTNNTPGDITDDTVAYNLSLRVENNDVTGQGIIPKALTGSNINVDTVVGSYILVADAIPVGTELAAIPTAPNANWEPVYTTSAVTTDANAALWKRFPLQGADTLTGITRVGFINKPANISSIAPGTTESGFSIQLKVKTGTTPTSLTINNIAQLFGQTIGNNAPVYDESGDQNPSNYDGPPGSMTPPPGTDTNNNGVPDTLPPSSVDDGYVDNPANPETGTDPNNNNTGTGPGGEANPFTISTSQTSAILNGPQNAPDALGPSGQNNDDFTNKSSLVPAGIAPGSTIDPQSVGFTNTIKNSGTNPGTIVLVPTPPATATDLPNDTVVTISYNGLSTAYTYKVTAGVGAFSLNSGSTVFNIPNVAAGANINYGVEVDLPPGTQLSTDINRGFPVPITAFIDGNSNNSLDANEARNITIDRVYTGFLKLQKFSRILQGTSSLAVGTGQDQFATTPDVDADKTNDVPRTPVPGNIIEYQIRYSNISEPQAGTGNVILNVDKLVITEDGTTKDDTPSGTNNWALDNDGNSQIDTSNVIGSAKDSGTATIQFFSGNNPANTAASDITGNTVTTDVTKYVDTVTGQVAPGVQRTFTFQRKVN
jgi:hypothetical protein